jgi:hypothetical protein
MSAYLYLFYASGGDLAGLTLMAGPNDVAALGAARRFLADRDDVRLVEVWRDARLVAQASA